MSMKSHHAGNQLGQACKQTELVAVYNLMHPYANDSAWPQALTLGQLKKFFQKNSAELYLQAVNSPFGTCTRILYS